MFGRGARNAALEQASRRLPLLRRVPVIRLIFLAELALIARRHFQSLTPAERRRLFELLRKSWHLTPKQKKELRRLVAKLEPRAFVGSAANRLSPLPLPRRLTKAKY